MAGLNKKLRKKYRPCVVGGEKALFHQWEDVSRVIEPSPMVGGHPGGIIRYTLGIIEREDGSIGVCHPSEIVFCDSKDLFSEYFCEEEDDE